MAQPATIIDAPAGTTVKLGSLLITFAQAGQLLAEDVTFDKGFAALDVKDAFGVTNKVAYSPTKGGGSMTLQFRTAADGVLAGDTFSLTGVACIVTKTGPRYTQNGASKIQIEYAERMNSPTLGQTNLFDGNFYPNQVNNNTDVTPTGPPLFHYPFPKNNTAVVMRQQYTQDIRGWVRQSMNTPYPFNPSLLLVDETELQDTGVAGVVTWDRIYAAKPADHNEPITVTKNYQAVNYVIQNNTTIADRAINNWSAVVQGTMFYHFFILGQETPTLPITPTVGMGQYSSNGRFMTDYGTSFPAGQIGTTAAFGFLTNFGVNTFVSGVIEVYMGQIMVKKTIYAT